MFLEDKKNGNRFISGCIHRSNDLHKNISGQTWNNRSLLN